MLYIQFLPFLIFDILIINADSKTQSRQYQNIFNRPSFNYQQQQPYANPKWFYSANQQPLTQSWYWTNNDVPSSNFYKNTLPFQQADQLENWACGRSQTTNRFARIMGGQDAVPHSYPWMVSLAKRSLNNLHLCGGVLLTRRHVLTAAHCIEDFKGVSDMNILAGIHYTNEKKSPVQALTIDMHPQYDPETFANDVAIITLASPLPENDPRIGTICLPPDDAMTGKNYPPTKSSGIAIGWGSTSFGARPSTALKQVVLPILETTKWPCNVFVTHAQGQICAGELSGGADTCQADSGLMKIHFYFNYFSFFRWTINGRKL
jgi:guanylate cyclase